MTAVPTAGSLPRGQLHVTCQYGYIIHNSERMKSGLVKVQRKKSCGFRSFPDFPLGARNIQCKATERLKVVYAPGPTHVPTFAREAAVFLRRQIHTLPHRVGTIHRLIL